MSKARARRIFGAFHVAHRMCTQYRIRMRRGFIRMHLEAHQVRFNSYTGCDSRDLRPFAFRGLRLWPAAPTPD